MPKLILNDVTNLGGNPISAQQVINTNSDRIEAAMEKTLSRDGSSPNQMEADLDMNHYDILNAATIHSKRLLVDGVLLEDLATKKQLDKEVVDRIAGDKALTSLIGQAGPIEVPLYDTRSDVTFANIKPTINAIRTGGYSSVGDGGGALYKRVATEPPHPDKVQSADGAWWEGGEDPFVILITGQSNAMGSRAFNWDPAHRAYVWPYVNGTPTASKFTTMPDNIMSVSYAFGSEVSRELNRPVFVIRIGVGGLPIAHWMVGAPSPDMFAACKTNVEAALATIGKNRIDAFLWWQGENDASSPINYHHDFNTVMSRFQSQSWFPSDTPAIVFGIAPASINGSSSFSFMNRMIQAAVGEDPTRRLFVDTGSIIPDASDWIDTLHASGSGYLKVGKVAALNYLRGVGQASIPKFGYDQENIRYSFGRVGATSDDFFYTKPYNGQITGGIRNISPESNARSVWNVLVGGASLSLINYGASFPNTAGLVWNAPGPLIVNASDGAGEIRLQVSGTTAARANNFGGLVLKPPANSSSVLSNGDLVIERANDMTLRFRMRGSDGVLRIATLALVAA